MATIKSFTDLEQSKKLAKILPLESADMCYSLPCGDGDKPLLEQGGFGSTPCWSLTSLLDVLRIYTIPTAFSTNISAPSLTKTKDGYSITYVGDYRIMDSNNNDIESPIEIVTSNPVDACYEMILKLHELDLV